MDQLLENDIFAPPARGKVVLMRGFTEHKVTTDGRTFQVSFSPQKGAAFKNQYAVFLYLGTIDKKNLEKLSVEDILKSQGWTPPSEKKEKTKPASKKVGCSPKKG